MRDRFIGMYQSILYKKNVYEEVRRRSEKLLFWVRFTCAVISILSVLVWSIAKSMPVLWACLIASAQIAQTLIDQLPWSAQIRALQFLVPDLISLLCEIDKDWMRIDYGDLSDDAVLLDMVAQYEKRFCDLEAKYTNNVWFPISNSIREAADKETDAYLNLRYKPGKGSDADGQEESSQSTDTYSTVTNSKRQFAGETEDLESASAAERQGQNNE